MHVVLYKPVKDFAHAVSQDAQELIGRTVIRATGQHFDDYVSSGGVPPLSLLFKAYAASSAHHMKRALFPPPKLALNNPNAEIINPAGQVVGHTSYNRDE